MGDDLSIFANLPPAREPDEDRLSHARRNLMERNREDEGPLPPRPMRVIRAPGVNKKGRRR